MKHDITVDSPLWKDILSVIVGFFVMVSQVFGGIVAMIGGCIGAIFSGGCITILIGFLILLILAAGH